MKSNPSGYVEVRGETVDVFVARNFWERLLGVYWFKPNVREAILFPDCSFVHTIGSPALGVILLDENYTVIDYATLVQPFRIYGSRRAKAVLECHPYSPLMMVQKGETLLLQLHL